MTTVKTTLDQERHGPMAPPVDVSHRPYSRASVTIDNATKEMMQLLSTPPASHLCGRTGPARRRARPSRSPLPRPAADSRKSRSSVPTACTIASAVCAVHQLSAYRLPIVCLPSSKTRPAPLCRRMRVAPSHPQASANDALHAFWSAVRITLRSAQDCVRAAGTRATCRQCWMHDGLVAATTS